MQNPMERKAHGRSGRAGYGVDPEGRKAGGLVVTEAGVPHQLEGRFSGGAAKKISRNAAVKAEHGASIRRDGLNTVSCTLRRRASLLPPT